MNHYPAPLPERATVVRTFPPGHDTYPHGHVARWTGRLLAVWTRDPNRPSLTLQPDGDTVGQTFALWDTPDGVSTTWHDAETPTEEVAA